MNADATSRPRRNRRPRDELGRPLPYGSPGEFVDGEPVVRSSEQALLEADRLFRAGRPFHAHEVLEDAWKQAPDSERELWRGLAQLAVGVTHAARGNRVGALALLRRGSAALVPYEAGTSVDLDVHALRAWSRDEQDRCSAQVPVVLPAPPLIR
ncbi:DUF309 domain-containing protein [Jatrophihabitans telluris]|uniref:DUF309 domain-containing protein n=1 Tax=Jatrophihabitans telluris TaxID=2038343 RepID=A0ABY4QVS4_9ACTN|nr:DUF309 domain-containing protein [Jatrophihabitans telluris]UQX87433.1 DUF309 domain-containing protein [Jatrophihabitans telluris]